MNLNTHELLAGVDRAAKIIDYFLLMPKSLSDAYCYGALLLQAAISKNFKFSPERFLISPQAMLSIVFSCRKLHYFVSLDLHTDHKALDHLENVDLDNITSNRVLQSLESILQHNISIQYVKKNENKIADYLSRLGGPGAEAPEFLQFLKVPRAGSVHVMNEGSLADPLLPLILQDKQRRKQLSGND